MANKKLRMIICLMLCAVIVYSVSFQAVALSMEDFELTPKESVAKSDAQVQAVMDTIDMIGTVEYSDDCLGKIVNAENAYEALKIEQKEHVLNYGKLLAARSGYTALAADRVDTSGYTITDSGVINGTVRWYVYYNGVLEITGTGSVPSYSSNAPWQSYVTSIKTIIVRSSISGIGASAFSGCNNITSITLPFVGASRDATGWKAHFGFIFGYSASNVTNYSSSGTWPLYRPLGASSYEQYSQSFTVGTSDSYNNTEFVNGYSSSSFPSTPWYTCRDGVYRYSGTNGNTNYYGQIKTYTYNVPASLNTVCITDATTVADGAFNFCKNITSITLNDSISSIGKGAFQRCTALTGFAIPNHVASVGEFAFNGDTALTEMHIPDGVTTIEAYSFYECNQLSRLVISRNATSIGSYAFCKCSALPRIVIPNSVETISNNAFENCSGATSIVISENAESIGSAVFQGCTKLTEVSIPDTVSSLGTYVFSGDTKITTLRIGSGVRTIPSYAFQNCTGLTAVTVPDTVTTINAFAFSGCNNVTSITLPFVGASRDATGWKAHFGFIFGYSASNVTNYSSSGTWQKELYRPLGDSSYETYLQSFTVGTSDSYNNTEFVNGYSSSSFPSTPWYTCRDGVYRYSGTNGNTNYYGQIKTYTYNVPASLNTVCITDATTVADGAFNFCKNITSITLNDSISSIGAYAFQRAPWFSNLNDEFNIVGDGVLIKYSGTNSGITLPETVKYIGGAVFEKKTNISEVVMTDQVTGIGAYTFSGCTNLTSITIPKTVTNIGREAIPSTCTIRVYQPSAGYNYRSTNRVVLNSSFTTGQDTFYYVVDENDLVEIIGTTTTSTEITVPEEIDGKSVQRIGDYGFAGCTSLNSITIPSNIKYIGKHAFDGCTGLINATIPTTVDSVGDYAFNNCTNLHNVTISEGVKQIGKGCFYNCTSLEEAVVPDTVETLGAYAFYNCSAMTTATIGISTDAVKEYTFYNCTELETIVIGISVESIGDYAFYNCALTKVTIPASTKYIGKYAFANNSDMTKATHRKGIITIDEYAYLNCSMLNTVTLPSSLTTINRGAFLNCSSLVTMTLPASLTYIGVQAFENCTSLPSVTIPVGVTVLNDFVFSNCSALATVTFNSNVTHIGQSAFYNSAFEAITLPETVETIDNSAFRHCVNLTEIRIPDATKAIGDAAFFDCSALTFVSLPDDVQNVGSSAFKHNNELTAEIRFLTGTVANSLLEKQGVCHVVLDENITAVGNLVFAYCYDLKDITYGENTVNAGDFLFSTNLTDLGSEVFKDATLLKNLIIPDTIQAIGANAFYNPVVSGNNTRDVTVTFYYVGGVIAEEILKGQRISHIYVNDQIRTIGDSAFNTCPILESVSLPDTITSCGTTVFANSGGNVAAYFRGVDGTVDAEVYRNKTAGLTYLVFDENINTIGSNAFSGATTVKGVLIKDTATISDHAFANSSSIYGVVIEKAILIDDYAFHNDTALNYVEIGQVVTVDDYAFAECVALKRVELDSVVNINDYAFYNCIAMDNVYIDANLVHIGAHAFEECKLIPEMLLPDTVREIGAYAFYNCNSLASINIPYGVPAINSHTFFGCASLQAVDLPDTVNRIEDYAYYGCVLINDLSLGNAVTFIGEYAFYNCNKVTTILLPETLVTIEDYAFRGCTSIEEIYLPDSVQTVGDCVFYACVGLEQVVFGSSITSIGDRVFYACVNLSKLVLLGPVDYIHDLAFYGAEDVVVYTPYNEYVIEYCEDNGIEYVIMGDVVSILYGDVNSDGEVDTTDAVRLVRFLVDLVELTDDQKQAADVNHDEDLTSADSIRLVRYLVGFVESLDQGEDTKPISGEMPNGDTNGPTVCVETVSGNPGDTVNVPVTIEENTGFAGFTLEASYPEGLTLTKVTKGTLLKQSDSGALTSNLTKNLINWNDSENTTGNGQLFVFTFRIDTTAAGGSYQVSLALKDGKPGNFVDENESPVCVTFVPGAVTIDSHEHQFEDVVTQPTCIDQGYTTHTCSICGVSYVDSYVDALGHDWAEWIVTTPPSTTESGEETRSCNRCGATETREVDPILTTITVASTSCQSGEIITVPVTITGNTGFAGFTFTIFGADGLTLTNIEKGCLLNDVEGMFTKNVDQYQVNWTSVENVTGDGELMVLSFEVGNNVATGDYAVSLALKDGAPSNFANENENPITVTFSEGTISVETMPFVFEDVPDDAWYLDAVLWAYYHEPQQITAGTTETTFSPNRTCTRAQIVTFLWRAAGSPEPSITECPFNDVWNTEAWYYKAVLWAYENGITSGVSDSSFGIKQGCTRAQVVTFLWRLAGSHEPTSMDSPFEDVQNSSTWYYKAVLWAAENQVTAGTAPNVFSPSQTCTRAQVVTFLYRYYTGNDVEE